MLNGIRTHSKNGGIYFANWDILMAWFASEPYEVAIVGPDFETKRKELEAHYLPNVFICGGETEGKLPLLENKLRKGETIVYVCQNESCQRPVQEVNDAMKQILMHNW